MSCGGSLLGKRSTILIYQPMYLLALKNVDEWQDPKHSVNPFIGSLLIHFPWGIWCTVSSPIDVLDVTTTGVQRAAIKI